MTPEEIRTFDQARAVFAQHGLAVEKATESKIWLVGGSQRLDKGGVIQEARALAARKAQQEAPTRPAPDRRWSSYAQAGNNALVPLREIRTDGGTQSRTRLDPAKVAEYAEALEAGATFPPVTLFYSGEAYWLADGFHRVAAYRHGGAGPDYAIPADVRQGTRRDAVLFACGANATHGLPRSTEDKENAVLTLLRDLDWSQWSNREIARRCHVSHDFVGKVAERHGLTGRAASQKTYTTRHGTTATMQTASIAAANTARAQDELTADPQPGEIHPLIAAVMEPAAAAPPTAPPPGRGMPPTPPVIELPVQLLTTGWRIAPPSGSSAFFVAHNTERGVSTHGFVALEQAISAAEHAQALIDEIEAQGWTIQQDLADPRRLRATHPHNPTITGAASLAALLHVLPAMRDHPATPAPAIGTQTTTTEDTDIGDQLAALEAHGWRWHGATYTAEGWVHLIADRQHADLARQRLNVTGIANLLRMFDQAGASPRSEQPEPVSDRPAPLVPQVLVLANQPDPYTLPEREILTVLYHTAEMVAGRRPDDTTCKRRQERVYCLPDEAAQEHVAAAFTHYQATLTAIAEQLRTLGTYESRLAAAGGSERAPNPLTPTAIAAPDPDGYHAPSFDHALKVPRAERSVLVNHTAKMLRIERSAATISSQAGYFVCPDEAAWEQLEELRANATEAHAVLVELLAELGTYQQALADGRYSHQAAPTPERPKPAINWSDVDAQTELIRTQVAQRRQAGIISAALDLLRLVAGSEQIVLPIYPIEEADALGTEIRVLLEQQLDVAAPTVAGFLRAVGRVVDVPPKQ